MSNTIFRRWTDAVRYLNEKIKKNQLLAGRNIQLEDTGHGIRINCDCENSPNGGSYNGMFKMIDISTPATDTEPAVAKIKIVHGLDEEATECGIVQVNNLASQAVTATELTITGDCYIYRKAVAVMSDSPETMINAEVTFEQSTSYPEWEAGIEKEVLGEVKFADKKITDFWYIPLPSRINIKGAC